MSKKKINYQRMDKFWKFIDIFIDNCLRVTCMEGSKRDCSNCITWTGNDCRRFTSHY